MLKFETNYRRLELVGIQKKRFTMYTFYIDNAYRCILHSYTSSIHEYTIVVQY